MATEVGKRFVDFKLKNQDGETVTLADFAGKWLVLYVYPKGSYFTSILKTTHLVAQSRASRSRQASRNLTTQKSQLSESVKTMLNHTRISATSLALRLTCWQIRITNCYPRPAWDRANTKEPCTGTARVL